MADQKDSRSQADDVQKDPQSSKEEPSQPKQPLAESTLQTETRCSKENDADNLEPSDNDKKRKQQKGKKKGNKSEAKPSLSENKSKSDLEMKEEEMKDRTKVSSEKQADEPPQDKTTNDSSTGEKKDIEEESEGMSRILFMHWSAQQCWHIRKSYQTEYYVDQDLNEGTTVMIIITYSLIFSDEGIEDLGNLEELDGAGRNALFERANQYESKGKKKCALKCYLKCLTGLKDTVGFSFLPQCLRRVADLYFEKEECILFIIILLC